MRNKTKSVKLLAIDLDDTLLRGDLSISEENRKAIIAAENAGVDVVLASGRSPEAMDRYRRELGMDTREGFMIVFNGSSIRRSRDLEEVWGIRLDHELAREVIQAAASRGWPVQTYRRGEILFNFKNEYTDMDSRLTGQPNRQVSESELLSEDPVKLIVPGEPEGLARLEQEFRGIFDGRANLFRSKPYFFEIMHPGADKGIALEHLAGLCGFRREEVMAIGDAMNDEGMLRWAGIPVAMANALPQIREISVWVTTHSNEEDGVAEAIDRFILSE